MVCGQGARFRLWPCTNSKLTAVVEYRRLRFYVEYSGCFFFLIGIMSMENYDEMQLCFGSFGDVSERVRGCLDFEFAPWCPALAGG